LWKAAGIGRWPAGVHAWPRLKVAAARCPGEGDEGGRSPGRFEIITSRSARDAGIECPHCGSAEVGRRFTTFSTGGSRTSLNPGTFVKEKGRPVRHEKPPGS
jgi:hypothetical protein